MVGSADCHHVCKHAHPSGLLAVHVCVWYSLFKEEQTPLSAVASITLAEWRQAECKVKELSQRGFAIAPLLDFYTQLGTAHLMCHYQPELSTTRDVVWGAVLPWSQSARCAAATLFQDANMRGEEGEVDAVPGSWL